MSMCLQVSAEFHHFTNSNLQNQFYAEFYTVLYSTKTNWIVQAEGFTHTGKIQTEALQKILGAFDIQVCSKDTSLILSS